MFLFAARSHVIQFLSLVVAEMLRDWLQQWQQPAALARTPPRPSSRTRRGDLSGLRDSGWELGCDCGSFNGNRLQRDSQEGGLHLIRLWKICSDCWFGTAFLLLPFSLFCECFMFLSVTCFEMKHVPRVNIYESRKSWKLSVLISINSIRFSLGNGFGNAELVGKNYINLSWWKFGHPISA